MSEYTDNSPLVKAFMSAKAKKYGRKYTKLTAEQKAERVKNRKKSCDAYVIFNKKCGRITFSRSACKMLDITSKTKINVINIDESYCVSVKENGDAGYNVSPCGSAVNVVSYCIVSTALVKSILADLKISAEICKIPIATIPAIHEGKEIFTILTKSLTQDTQ